MISITEAMDAPELFKPWFPGETWDGWRTILKGAFALPMTEDETAFFRTVAERDPPAAQVKELWIIAGRRAGKDAIASTIAAYAAALFEDTGQLRPGERTLVACLAVDRDQARIVKNYTASYFQDIPLLTGMIERETAQGFELSNRVDVAVSTNSFRAVRGRPILCAILDELAFWRDESSATPDEECYRALKPATATMPGAMIIGISSPYRKSGLLYKKFRDHYGKPGNVLVIKAPTLALNPTIDPAIISEALEDDPEAAKAEWLGEFRSDIAAFVTREALEACIEDGAFERKPISTVRYEAFVDPSGGSSDSMTLAIAHREKDKTIVLDAIREERPPFSPETTVASFAEFLKTYRVGKVSGDRYAGEWPREQFRKHGIAYEVCTTPKSGIYQAVLPQINSGNVSLLDHKRMQTQFLGLERRTARSGRDSIDHGPGQHDDIANAVAGSIHCFVNHTPSYNMLNVI